MKGPYSDARVAQLFWAKVDRSRGDDDCWVWTGRIEKSKRNAVGYGVLWARRSDGKTTVVKAHRFAYELLIGKIPVGMRLDHKVCSNTLCVNPSHMNPTTAKGNAQNRNPLAALGVHRAGWHWVVVQKIDAEYVEIGVYQTVMSAVARALEWHGIK